MENDTFTSLTTFSWKKRDYKVNLQITTIEGQVCKNSSIVTREQELYLFLAQISSCITIGLRMQSYVYIFPSFFLMIKLICEMHTNHLDQIGDLAFYIIVCDLGPVSEYFSFIQLTSLDMPTATFLCYQPWSLLHAIL